MNLIVGLTIHREILLLLEVVLLALHAEEGGIYPSGLMNNVVMHY